MTYDVLCLGRPFLDLVFTGLEELPGPGIEVDAEALHISAGGIANTVVGLHRLGLATALVGPRGRDLAGREIARLLAEEGVDWLGPEVPHSGLTVAIPIGSERTMLTFDPAGEAPDRDQLEALAPRAVAGDHPEIAVAGARRYVGAGYVDASAAAGNPAAVIGLGDTLIVNELEATILTGAPDAEAACIALTAHVPTAVVTVGAAGAMACDGGPVRRAAPPPGPVIDTLGAGDLFTAAYIWADLAGLSLQERLNWAVLFASLSVRVPTTLGGAPRLERLLEEGRTLGLVAPGDRAVQHQTTKEGEEHARR
jgi:sugar/nucleoside kinase (ribokinase family)